jgi:hypothetical protein
MKVGTIWSNSGSDLILMLNGDTLIKLFIFPCLLHESILFPQVLKAGYVK